MANVVAGNKYNITLFQKGYPTQGRDSYSLVASNNVPYLHSFSAFNANGSASDIGLGIAHATTTWKLLQYPNGTPVDVTASIQAGSTVNIFDTTTNHGFLIESSKQFGYCVFNLTQAQSGSPVYTYEYFNGSAWVTLNLSQTPGYTSTGLAYIVFNPPADWALGDNSLTANSLWSIRVKASTAGGQAVQANSLRVARWITYRAGIPTQSQLQAVFDAHPYRLESGEAIVPFFASANNLNSIEAAYQQAP